MKLARKTKVSLPTVFDQRDNVHVKLAREVDPDTSWSSAHLPAIRFHFLEALRQPANQQLGLLGLYRDLGQVEQATDVNVKLGAPSKWTNGCPVDVGALQKRLQQSRSDIVITLQGFAQNGVGRDDPVQLWLIDAYVAEEAFELQREFHRSIMHGPHNWCQAEVRCGGERRTRPRSPPKRIACVVTARDEWTFVPVQTHLDDWKPMPLAQLVETLPD